MSAAERQLQEITTPPSELGPMAEETTASNTQPARSMSAAKKPTKISPTRALVTRMVRAGTGELNDEGAAPKVLNILTSATEEEIEACYPTFSLITGAFNPGRSCLNDQRTTYLKRLERLDAPDESVPTSAERLRDALLAGSFLGSPEIIDESLKKGADLACCDASGRNCLHYLSSGGHTAVLVKVLKRLHKQNAAAPFAEILNKKDQNNWTPLLLAVCRSHVGAVDALLAYSELDLGCTLTHSCPPCRGPEKPESGALHLSAIRGSGQIIVKLLDKGLLIEQEDSMKRNLFHYLAANNNETLAGGCLAVLMKHHSYHAKLLLCQDVDKRSPLFIAIANGASDLANQMIRNLHQARVTGALESFSLTKDVVEHQDEWMMTCIQSAYLKRHYEVIHRLSHIWSLYCHPEVDEDSFSLVLLKQKRGSSATTESTELPSDRPSSPTLLIMDILNDTNRWTDWLKAEMSGVELTAFSVIKQACQLVSTTGTGSSTFRSGPTPRLRPINPNHERMLIRAIRRCGIELLMKTLDNVMRSGLQAGATVEQTFFGELRSLINGSMSAVESRAAWKFITAENVLQQQAPKPPEPKSTEPRVLTTRARSVSSLHRSPTVENVPLSPRGKSPPVSTLERRRQYNARMQAARAMHPSEVAKELLSNAQQPSFAAPTHSRLQAAKDQAKERSTKPLSP